MIYKSCDTLPLKNFLQILKTGELKYLCADEQEQPGLEGIWEDIIQEFGEIDQSSGVKSDFRQVKKIKTLEGKRLLSYLCFIYLSIEGESDHAKEVIEILKQLGFSVDTKSLKESISKALKRSKNYINLLNMEYHALERLRGDKGREVSYDEIVVWLQTALAPAVINEDKLTVKRFVEYKKLIKKKNGRNK